MKQCDYVSSEVAELLKGKGCHAALFDDVIDWFKAEHAILVRALPYEFKWEYSVEELKGRTEGRYTYRKQLFAHKMYNTCGEALNEGIKEALKMI